MPPTVVFPLLSDPEHYVACGWDLTRLHAQRAYWLGLFRTHFPTLLREAAGELAAEGVPPDDAARRLAAAGEAFAAYLDAVEIEPARHGRLDILEVCKVRERALRDAGIADPYRRAKARENEASLAVLPALLAELDALPADARAEVLMLGVFAGNIFDLGATATEALFREACVDFHAVRARLKPRPWLVDDLGRWLARWERGPHRQALLFVDNAGSDVLLGMLPLAREMLRRGTRVILAANATPSLNDITHTELRDLLARVAAWDAPLREAWGGGRLELISSGNGLPLIDLREISPELAAATRERRPDLVVLEGMGRGVESNFDARLTCETLKVAMIKDTGVADALGGTLYDLVLRYELPEHAGEP